VGVFRVGEKEWVGRKNRKEEKITVFHRKKKAKAH
jgi:hypothetical protein